MVIAIAFAAIRVVFEPAAGNGFDDGPIVALGGGSRDRLDTALQLRQPDDRVLVLSGTAILRYNAWFGSCDEPSTICLIARPLNTYGEALGVAQLAKDYGWPRVTIVTSDYHAYRTRLLFNRCSDTGIEVVGVSGDLSVRERTYLVTRETVAIVQSWLHPC
jgi:hypothetical protein